VAQPWRPRACHCGRFHSPDDPADLILLIGTPDPSIPQHSDALILLATAASPSVDIGLPVVVAPSRRDFGRWSSELARNLFAPLLIAGLIGYDFADLTSLLRSASRFEFAYVTGSGGLVGLARRLVESSGLRPGEAALGNLLLTGRQSLTLFDVNEAVAIAQEPMADGSSCMCACVVNRENEEPERASLLFARQTRMDSALPGST
jgi:hypothetical protein